MKLMLNALTKYLAGVVLVGLLLFPAAGTIFYPNGWRLMAHLFLPMAVFGIILFCKAPELLKKRLNGREKQPEQKRVVALSAFLFVAAFLAAGLDFRCLIPWSSHPRDCCWSPMACTPRSCGKTLTSPVRWRFRRGRRSLTPGCTASSATPCTPPPSCFTCRCRWCWAHGSPSPCSCPTRQSSSCVSETKRRSSKKDSRVTGSISKK